MANKTLPVSPQLAKAPFGWVDCFVLLLLGVVVSFFYYKIRYEFTYDWEWSSIPQFLFRKDADGWVPGILGKGLITTLRLSIWSALGAFIIGMLLAIGRCSKIRYLEMLSRTFIEISRNLPPLVLVFIFCYLLSGALLPWDAIAENIENLGPKAKYIVEILVSPIDTLGVFIPAVFTLAIYEGAYMAEIFRGGLLSIPKGQIEASYCLGLSRFQQLRYVVMPQMLRNVLPQLSGQFISTIKDSAIVSVVSLEELTYSGQQLMSTIRNPFEVWITVAALYLLLTFGLSMLFKRLER